MGAEKVGVRSVPRKSFSVHADFYDELNKLTGDQRGAVLSALIAWASDDGMPDLDPVSSVLFRMMCAQMERISSANSANGAQRWKSRAGEPSALSESSERTRDQPSAADPVTHSVNVPRTAAATAPHGRARTRGEASPIEPDPRFAAVAEAFSENLRPPTTPAEADLIRDWTDSGADTEVVLHAIREAALQGGRNPKYADRVLTNLLGLGIRTADQLAAHEIRRQNAKARQTEGAQPRAAPTDAMTERAHKLYKPEEDVV